MLSITQDEFRTLSTYIYSLCGISLDDSKKYLLETRLGGLLQEVGASSYSELYFKAKSDVTNILKRKVIDAVTTNETLFFRDTSPFDLLQHKILPDLIDARSKANKYMPVSIRLLSAACSTGQEIYSVAIVLKELLGDLTKYRIKLLGTDISDSAIAQASRGIYNKVEMERGLPPGMLQKYFTDTGSGWKIRDEIRAMATFTNHNLMSPLAGLGKFDIVFCRNVAIYFNEKDKTALFDKIAGILEPDGYLIIGSTESIAGICPRFESKRYLRSVFYQLKG